ncbi:glycoside hydrolase family 13 protein [Mycena polygramma]|nr:glycoside hydrolase family 13 protein [Mycena polygramma]
MYSYILLLSLVILSAFRCTLAASASDWRGRSIYQVVTDRFAGSTTPCDPRDRRYCGGSWKGIMQRLDYIQHMGFTAIWISPVVEQIDGSTGEGEAYHGYWPKNLYTLNSNFGTEQDLKDLVAAVHSRGMYIMVDHVSNHFANAGDDIKYSEFWPFNDSRYFHPKCDINWGNQTSIENCWMGNGYVWLADINTESPEVGETLEKHIASFVTTYNIDGLRLDAGRCIPKPFWSRLSRAANVYTQGEVWVRDPSVMCPYQEHMDGLHNYPLKELATEALKLPAGDMAGLVNMARQLQAHCKDVTLLGLFMENHDNPRLGSLTTDMARLKNFAALNVLGEGMPIVYYGQEQALTGSYDPMNREALWLTGYPTTNNLVPTFTAFNKLRNHLVKGAPSSFLTKAGVWTFLNSNAISVRRGNVVLVLTNSGEGVVIEVVIDGFGARLDLVEILTCGTLHTDGKGKVNVSLRGEPMVLYPKALLSKSTICGL